MFLIRILKVLQFCKMTFSSFIMKHNVVILNTPNFMNIHPLCTKAIISAHQHIVYYVVHAVRKLHYDRMQRFEGENFLILSV